MRIIRIIILLGFFIAFSLEGHTQNVNDSISDRPKVAVVLSGGGAKGFAHIGVLKVLEEEGIPIDIIVGTSIGSLIGGIYSLGYSASEIEKIVDKQNWEMLLSDAVPRYCLSEQNRTIKQRYQIAFDSDLKQFNLPIGVVKGQNVINTFCGLAANVPHNSDFTQFPISYACVATNLETGNYVVFKNGFLPTAMYSSMAIPGVFAPFEHDGILLVDGGVDNNFPTDVAKQMGADIIIGVDIRGKPLAKDRLGSMDAILGQMVTFLGKGRDSVNLALCDVLIKPDISDYNVYSFTHEAADTLIARGEAATRALHDKFSQLKKKYKLRPKAISRRFVTEKKWNITQLKFIGNKARNKAELAKNFRLEIPGKYDADDIKTAVDKLYGKGEFDRLYFYLTDNENGKTLNLKIQPKNTFTQNIGFKVNTIDAAALMFNTSKKNSSNFIKYFSLSAELSANPALNCIVETKLKQYATFGFELNAKFQNYTIYNKGDKMYDADLFYSSLSFYSRQDVFDWGTVRGGIKGEYYKGDFFVKSSYDVPISLDKDHFWLTNLYLKYSLDKLDDFYFPTRGMSLCIEGSIDAEPSSLSNISPVLLFKIRKVFAFYQKTTLLLDLYNRSLFNEEYPFIKTTMVGGDDYSRYFNFHFPFMGLPPVSIADQYVLIERLSLRFNIRHKHYITLLLNSLQENDKITNLEDMDMIFGGGVKYSLSTLFGPLDIGLGYSNKNKNLTFSANLGFWF